MKITLIQKGGFAGQTKIAEEELSAWPTSLQEHVQKAFSQIPEKLSAGNDQRSRDKESYFLEFAGTNLPLEAVETNEETISLIKKMKANLKYEKRG